MSTFAVVAHRVTPTNTRLGAVVSPAQAIARLRPGDIAVGRLDVLPTLDGVEPGLWALERLAASGVTVLNGRRTLVAAHDKLMTAAALFEARVPHPRTVHVASWKPLPELEPPIVFKPRFGSWGEDVIRCDDDESIERALRELDERPWFHATVRSRRSSSRRAATTCGSSSPPDVSSAPFAASPRRASGGRTSRSAHGASRSSRRPRRARSRSTPRAPSRERSSESTSYPPTSARGSCSRSTARSTSTRPTRSATTCSSTRSRRYEE
jgi:hypothetical protein